MKFNYNLFYKIASKLFVIDILNLLVLILTKTCLYIFPQLNSILKIFLILKPIVTKAYSISLIILLITVPFLIILFTFEVIRRSNDKNDNPINIIRSTKSTHQLRGYLFNDINDKEKNNSRLKKTNKSISKLIVNIKNNEIIITIPDPTNITFDELFKSKKNLFEDKIRRKFPDFIFSNFELEGNQFVSRGTKV